MIELHPYAGSLDCKIYFAKEPSFRGAPLARTLIQIEKKLSWDSSLMMDKIVFLS